MRRIASTSTGAGRGAISAVGIAAIAIMACWGEEGLLPRLDEPISLAEVDMFNDFSNELPIHILGPQENPNPSNRLFPGTGRRTTVRKDLREKFGEVEFRAGRTEDEEFEVFDTRICNILPTGNEEDDIIDIIWIGGRLECE